MAQKAEKARIIANGMTKTKIYQIILSKIQGVYPNPTASYFKIQQKS